MATEYIQLVDMLNNKKITKDEYRLLIEALDKRPSKLNTLFTILINPFQKIAGWHALVIGIVIMLLLSYFGVLAGVYFDGVLGFSQANLLANAKIPPSFSLLLVQNIIGCLVLTLFFAGLTYLFGQKRIRVIDFIGTITLSRFPLLVMLLVTALGKYFNPAPFLEKPPFHLHIDMMYVIFGILISVFQIWQYATYYFAFKESSGLPEGKLWFGLAVSLVLGHLVALHFTRALVI